MVKYLRIATLIAFLSAPGCSDLGEPLQPECNIQTSTLDFGQLAPGETAEGSVAIRNTGDVEVSGDVSLSGAAFTLASGGGQFVLQPDEQLTVVVSFAPGAAGDYRGVLSTGAECGNVDITGTAVDTTPAATCEVSPPSIEFGDVALGGSADSSFAIRNTGTVSFSGTVGSLCGDFDVVAGGGAYTLAAGDSLLVTVRFSPSSLDTISCTISTGVDCGPVGVGGTGVPAQPTTSFASDIQPIFTGSCALAGCHAAPSPKAGMDLRAGSSYANTVGVTSTGYAPAIRVVPGDPGASVLYNKITNTGVYGGRMPPTGSLSAQQIELIRSWIEDGAPNN